MFSGGSGAIRWGQLRPLGTHYPPRHAVGILPGTHGLRNFAVDSLGPGTRTCGIVFGGSVYADAVAPMLVPLFV